MSVKPSCDLRNNLNFSKLVHLFKQLSPGDVCIWQHSFILQKSSWMFLFLFFQKNSSVEPEVIHKVMQPDIVVHLSVLFPPFF